MNDVTLNDFKSYFQNEIYIHTVKYEQHRVIAKVMANIIMPTVYLIFCGIIAFKCGVGESLLVFILSVLVGLVVIFIYFSGFVKKMYKNKVKKEILPKVLKFINMEVVDKRLISREIKNIIHSLNLFPYFNYCECDDCITGEYNGSKLTIYNIKLKKRVGTRKHRKTVTVFNGAYISLSNPNYQKADIVINSHSPKYSLEQIDIENETFNQEYRAFSNNPDEAKSFLTPDVIKEIIKYTKLNGKLYFSFEQNMINLKMISYNDLFEVSFDKNPSDITNYVNIIDEIEGIYGRLDFITSLTNNKVEEN